MNISFSFDSILHFLKNFFTPVEFTDMHTLAAICCSLILILGIGWVQDRPTRRRGISLLTIAVLYFAVAFFALSWVDTNNFMVTVWTAGILLFCEWIFMHIQKDSSPLGSVLASILFAVPVLAIAIIIVFPAMKMFGIMNDSLYNTFIYWTVYFYILIMNLYATVSE